MGIFLPPRHEDLPAEMGKPPIIQILGAPVKRHFDRYGGRIACVDAVVVIVLIVNFRDAHADFWPVDLKIRDNPVP